MDEKFNYWYFIWLRGFYVLENKMPIENTNNNWNERPLVSEWPVRCHEL